MRSPFFHPLLFYPTLAALAALAMLVSLRPVWPAQPLPAQAAQREGPAYDYSPRELAALIAGSAHEMFVPRDAQALPEGVRLARRMDSVGQDSPGAVLAFTPADAEAFTAASVSVDIVYRPLRINSAEGLSVRFAGAGDWVSAPLEPREGRIGFVLAAPSTAPSGLEIRVDSTRADYAYGVEVLAIRLLPTPASP
jgi:hypothetical protein